MLRAGRIGAGGEPFVLFLDDFEAVQNLVVLSLMRMNRTTCRAKEQIFISSRCLFRSWSVSFLCCVRGNW